MSLNGDGLKQSPRGMAQLFFHIYYNPCQKRDYEFLEIICHNLLIFKSMHYHTKLIISDVDTHLDSRHRKKDLNWKVIQKKCNYDF